MLSLKEISFIAAVVGIVMLFAIVHFSKPLYLEAHELNDKLIGAVVSVNSTITGISTNNGHVFLKLRNSSASAVIFQNRAKQYPFVYNLRHGDNVILEGKLELYREELEIVVNRIILRYQIRA